MIRVRWTGRRLNAAVPEALREILARVAEGCMAKSAARLPKGAAPSADIAVVGEARIRTLNREWRGRDRVTDVLSFPLLEYRNGRARVSAGDVDPDTGELPLGDIFLCFVRAREQAKRYGHSYEREIAFLTAHGLLHLFGFDHETEEEAAEMFALQEEILREAGISRDFGMPGTDPAGGTP